MPTLLDPAECAAFVQRLRRLQPAAPARWGSLTAPRMVCHATDALRIGFGELPAKRADTLPLRTLVKWIVVYSPLAPPRGKVETAPEMLTSTPASWPADVARLETLLVRSSSDTAGVVHPAFGPLSRDGWGRLNWKHLDHHFRQFGC